MRNRGDGMKCFLDANVLFSAANESSPMHRLLQTPLQFTQEISKARES